MLTDIIQFDSYGYSDLLTVKADIPVGVIGVIPAGAEIRVENDPSVSKLYDVEVFSLHTDIQQCVLYEHEIRAGLKPEE